MDCGGLFNPRRFIAHSHNEQENRTCHWGFDSTNWRRYLLVATKDETVVDKELENRLENFKARFDYKRKVRTLILLWEKNKSTFPDRLICKARIDSL